MTSYPNRKSAPKSLLGSFLHFLRSPDLQASPDMISPKEKLIRILRLFSLKWVIIVLVFLVLDIVNAPSGELVEDDFSISAISLFFSAVVLAPLLEELVFRLPLRPSVTAVAILYSLFIFWLSLWIAVYSSLLSAVLFVFVSFYIARTFIQKDFLQAFYRQHPYFLFYSSTLVFGAVHVFNYEQASWKLLPLLVFSQTIGGLLLGFVRIRYGFWWAVFLHAFHNSFVCLPVFAYKAFGSIALQRYALADGEEVAFSGVDNIVLYGVSVYEWMALLVSCVVVWGLVREWIKRDKVV